MGEQQEAVPVHEVPKSPVDSESNVLTNNPEYIWHGAQLVANEPPPRVEVNFTSCQPLSLWKLLVSDVVSLPGGGGDTIGLAVLHLLLL